VWAGVVQASNACFMQLDCMLLRQDGWFALYTTELLRLLVGRQVGGMLLGTVCAAVVGVRLNG
jgi:hypothetical protein